MKNDTPNLLLVDDSSTNNLLLESALMELDFNIITATSGKEALKHLQKKSFDLVLLDVMMPGLSGYDVLETMKSEGMLENTAVIMVTARSRVDEENRSKELGAADYFEKPIELQKLVARVKELLSELV
jgi:two-component system copper resistance phosphate regulon response regulator CusR